MLEHAVRRAAGSYGGPLTPNDLESVTVVSAPNCAIKWLDGIEALVNLRSLELSKNDVRDLTPLADLEHLAALDLSHMQLPDLEALGSLRELEVLNLGSSTFGSFAPLGTLAGLRWLNVAELRSFIQAMSWKIVQEGESTTVMLMRRR